MLKEEGESPEHNTQCSLENNSTQYVEGRYGE